MKKQSLVTLSVVCGLLLAGLFYVIWLQGQADKDRNARGPDVNPLESDKANSSVQRLSQPSVTESLGVSDADMVKVGGIQRPKRDVAFGASAPKMVDSEKSLLPHPGNAPAAPIEANEQVKQLFDELSVEIANREPSAVSSLFAPEAYDAKVYEKDKQKWLSQIRPGRAFQPAQPGPEVTPIKSNTRTFQRVVQGEKVVLEVVSEPGAPVTFYTPQAGSFPNQLTTHSVAANDSGVAQTTYTATAGTAGLINVVAASPVNSGLLRYRIHVSLPQPGLFIRNILKKDPLRCFPCLEGCGSADAPFGSVKRGSSV